jgi:hypothetical protein
MKRIALLAILAALWIVPARAVTLEEARLGNVFSEGERVSIPARGVTANLRWSLKDFFGTEVASGMLRTDATNIEPQITSLGYFTLEIIGEKGGQAAARTTLAIVPKTNDAADRGSPFGVMTHFAKGWPADIIPLIQKAGIRQVRDEQPWRLVERGRSQYAFPPRLNGFMSELFAHHIDPLVLLAFSNPLYDSDQTPFSDAGRAGYAAYARAVAEHYAPNISAVEIWNEYNGSFCTGPCRGNRPLYYSSMLKESYKTLKAANPSLTVLGGAAVPIPLDYYRQLFEQGALDAMDALVIHPYRKSEGADAQIEALRQLMTHYGKPKPIWATEFADLPDMRKSRDEEARYLVRMSTVMLSANVERMYWYLMRDYQEFTGLGLLHDDKDPLGRYAPAPAYVAYAILIHELDGAKFVRREAGDPKARAYQFSTPDGDLHVLWAAEPGATYEVASAAPMRRISFMGDERIVTPRDGKISLGLDENPIYLVADRAR